MEETEALAAIKTAMETLKTAKDVFGTKKQTTNLETILNGIIVILQCNEEELRELRNRVDALESILRSVRPDLEERLYDPHGVQVSRPAAQSLRKQWEEADQRNRLA